MVDSSSGGIDVPVGFRSAASARALAHIALEYADGRVYMDAPEGPYIRSIPTQRVAQLDAALDRGGGADRTTRFRVPESVRPSGVFMHQGGRMGVLVSAPEGSLSSEVIEGLARITERNAFDGMASTEDGRVAILGIDPTVVTEVIALAEQLGLTARTGGV